MAATSPAIHPTVGASPDLRADRNRRALRVWLAIVVLALFCLVLVGGATRLTNSGLSITEWKPVHGVIPPLSAAEWEEEFRLYQRIPEYQQINKGMTIDAFKGIFWWEWAHRLLARSIGVIFALPLAFFWLTGRVERRLRWPLFGIFLLGGFQGFIGWWMVSSGLTERTDVSQYRLATHLVIACLIYGACIYIMRGLSLGGDAAPAAMPTRRWALLLAALALFQIYLGALVAGLDAGFAYNTWPLMDGALVPQGLFLKQPWWINLFENPKTVQYVHRLGAYVLLAAAAYHALRMQMLAPGPHANRATLLFSLVVLQACLGIATLLYEVPLDLALAHQGGALVVLGIAIAHWRSLRGNDSLNEGRAELRA